MSQYKNNGKTLIIHELICSECGLAFKTDKRSQLAAYNAGRNVCCGDECRRNASNKWQRNYKPHLLGPCKTCGKMFRSRNKGKLYCSLPCYTGSDECRLRLRDSNEEKKLNNECRLCGQITKKSNKFCGDRCRRTYFRDRFDRFIANPEQIALPQNYDEFLTKEELPCLVDGCDWSGVRLGQHVNLAHGITADQMREIAGFNKTTGLATLSYKEKCSHKMKRMIEDGKISPGDIENCRGVLSHPEYRNEAKEHQQKTIAMNAGKKVDRNVRCRVCGKQVLQPLCGVAFYCSTICRTRYYTINKKAELNCSHCGRPFWGNVAQVRRARCELPVCCSLDCRNKRNWKICIEARREQQ